MSEDNQYVSQSAYNEQMKTMIKFMEAIAEQSDKNQSKAAAELETITNLSQRMDNVESNISKILNYLETPHQQTQPEQQQVQRPRMNLGDIGAQLRELISAAKEANLIPGDQPSELQRWGMAAAETAQREALLSIKRQVRAGMKKGLIDRPTVESIVDETLDRTMGGGGHEPIL